MANNKAWTAARHKKFSATVAKKNAAKKKAKANGQTLTASFPLEAIPERVAKVVHTRVTGDKARVETALMLLKILDKLL